LAFSTARYSLLKPRDRPRQRPCKKQSVPLSIGVLYSRLAIGVSSFLNGLVEEFLFWLY